MQVYDPKTKALYNQKTKSLTVCEYHNLAEILPKYDVSEMIFYDMPSGLEILSKYPKITKIRLHSVGVDDVKFLEGLRRLESLEIWLGTLSTLDLTFCAHSLKRLELVRLRRLKDLSSLPVMPRLRQLRLESLHGMEPPDFSHISGLTFLTINNTDWPSLRWLSHLPKLEQLGLWGNKIEDGDWRPILKLTKLDHVNGVKNVFKAAAVKELQKLRPSLDVDKGFRPTDSEKYREALELMKRKMRGHAATCVPPQPDTNKCRIEQRPRAE